MEKSRTIQNYKRSRIEFEVGDDVVLRPDVLVRHARSVPAHMGYTKEEFSWREILGRLDGMMGKIERVFPNSKHVNVKFEDGTLIGINSTELDKIGDVTQEGKMPKGGWDKKYRGERGGWFVATKQFRKPKKGEFYISGAEPTAYEAPNDLNYEFYIAKRVDNPPKTIKKDGFAHTLTTEKIRRMIHKEIVSIISEGDGKILLQDDDDITDDEDKTQTYTNENGVQFWAEFDPNFKAWICISQVDGYSRTQAHDEWFYRREDAESICKDLANGIL